MDKKISQIYNFRTDLLVSKTRNNYRSFIKESHYKNREQSKTLKRETQASKTLRLV